MNKNVGKLLENELQSKFMPLSAT